MGVGEHVTGGVTLDLPPEVLEGIAQRVAEILAGSTASAVDGGRWLRGAEQIGNYIDAPASRVYALHSAGRFPAEKDGSALVAHTAALDAWIRSGGGIRP
jgi:hypothetical protein